MFILMQVPLGIIMKNENELDQMVDILVGLHQYVPVREFPSTSASTDPDKETDSTDILHKLLIGGDLLTAIRAKGAQRIRRNSECPVGRLEGFIPVVEDWHAKVCLLEVCDLQSAGLPQSKYRCQSFICAYEVAHYIIDGVD